LSSFSDNTKDRNVIETQQSEILQGNVVRIPLPLELSVEKSSEIHERIGIHVREFYSVGKIEVNHLGLFDLPM
jgi:hypothetical protein